MGAHLRHAGDDLDVWDEALAKLRNAERLELDSSDTLFERLRISYAALAAPEQRMFLDAATIFLGRRADTVICAWRRQGFGALVICKQPCHACRPDAGTFVNRSGFSGAKTGLRVLVDRCLVRLQDSEGEMQREATKDTRLGMCARACLELSWPIPATQARRNVFCGRWTLSLPCTLGTFVALPV